MPSTRKNKKVNRTEELRRIRKNLTKKQFFPIAEPRTKIPNQRIQLFSTNLKENIQGQHLKEANPSEYLKQKQQLQVTQNRATRKYNTPKETKVNTTMANWLERMESEPPKPKPKPKRQPKKQLSFEELLKLREAGEI